MKQIVWIDTWIQFLKNKWDLKNKWEWNIRAQIFRKILLWLAGILLFCLFQRPEDQTYELRMQLRQDRDGYQAQLYWKHPGEVFDVNQSYIAPISGQAFRIPLTKEMLAWDTEWRFHPLNTEADIGITSFDLYQKDVWRKNFSADVLADLVNGQEEIVTYYSTGEDFYISTLGQEGSVSFRNELPRLILRHILLHTIMEIAVFAGLWGLMLLLSELPFIKRRLQRIRSSLQTAVQVWSGDPFRLAVWLILTLWWSLISWGSRGLPAPLHLLLSEGIVSELEPEALITWMLLVPAGAVCILCLLWADHLPGLRRIYTGIRTWTSHGEQTVAARRKGILFALLMLVLLFCLFCKILWGDMRFVYSGDSLYQTYPKLVRIADRILAGDWDGGYTFQESLGVAEGRIVPDLRTICAIAGREWVGILMGWAHLCKMFAAALFFYGFLRRMGTSVFGSMLFGMCYSCSAYLVSRGLWQSYPNEALCFAMWLWALEGLKRKRGKWIFLLVNLFCYWNYHGYSMIFYTGTGLMYGCFRMISEKEMDLSWKEVGKRIGTMLFIMTAGAALTAWIWLPSLQHMLSSDRVSDGLQLVTKEGVSFGYAGWEVWKTLFYRLLTPDLLGMEEGLYDGVENWLEDPVFYCGLATVLCLLPGLSSMTPKKRRWYFLPLSAALLYNIFDAIRYLANGCSGSGWKLSSLWIIVLLLIIAADCWQEGKAVCPSLGGKILVLVNAGILILAVLFYGEGVNLSYLLAAWLFCTLFSIILYLYWREADAGRKRYLSYLLMGLTAAELLTASYRVINSPMAVSGEYLARDGYEDRTMELLSEIQDPSFFRVEKIYSPISPCDTLYQQYQGTTSYIGGVGDSKATREVYRFLGMPVLQHLQRGSGKSTAVHALLNVKYILTYKEEGLPSDSQDPQDQEKQHRVSAGWKFLRQIQGSRTEEGQKLMGDTSISLYENLYTLPFGYVYDSYLEEESAWALPMEDRRLAMLSHCMIQRQDLPKISGQLTSGQESMDRAWSERFQEYRIDYSLDESGRALSFAPVQEDQVLIVKTETQAELESWGSLICMMEEEKIEENLIQLNQGSTEQFQEFHPSEANRLVLEADAATSCQMKDVELYVIPEEIYYKEYESLIRERSQGALEIVSAGEEKIEGTTTLEKGGIMVFTIPYDTGWKAYVNGAEQEMIPVNIGFMGLLLETGTYEICLEYTGRG